jgi:hypothetical protein
MPEGPDAQTHLRALLHDLDELAAYLHGRGQNAYTLAQRFLDNARREKDQQIRAYDEQQAKMLDYQHYIWHEIAGMVEKLSAQYGGEAPDTSDGAQWKKSTRENRLGEETVG